MKIFEAKQFGDCTVTEDAYTKALAKGAKRPAWPVADVSYNHEKDAFVLAIDGGGELTLPRRTYAVFEDIPIQDLHALALNFDRSAISIKEHDLNVSLSGMIQANEQLMTILLTVAGSRNGRLRSDARAAASAQNGLRGGRPKRTKP